MPELIIDALTTVISDSSIYIAKGKLDISGIPYNMSHMIVFYKTENPSILALEDTTLLLLEPAKGTHRIE